METRRFIHDTLRKDYLFVQDLPAQVDCAATASPEEFLETLIRKAKAEGKDRWTCILEKQEAVDSGLWTSRHLGPDKGFGFVASLVQGKVVLLDVRANSGAGAAGLRRGDELLARGATPGLLAENHEKLQAAADPSRVLFVSGTANNWGATPRGTPCSSSGSGRRARAIRWT